MNGVVLFQPFSFLLGLLILPRRRNRHKADTNRNGMRQIPECIKNILFNRCQIKRNCHLHHLPYFRGRSETPAR